MASSMSSLHARLEDELSCPVCFERYNNRNRLPKALPCQHTFCKRCLTSVMTKVRANPTLFPCPICQEPATNYSTVDAFKTNLTITSMLDIVQSNDCGSSSDVNECQTHPGKNISHVCTSCYQLMCTKCLTSLLKETPGTTHKHDIEEIEDAISVARKEIQKSEHEFDQLVENKRRHRKSCQNIIESEKELLKEQIRIAVANRIKQLHNLKLRLSIEVDQAYEDTLETKTLFDDYLAKGQGYLDKLKNLTDNKTEINGIKLYKQLQKFKAWRSENESTQNTVNIPSGVLTTSKNPMPEGFVGNLVFTSHEKSFDELYSSSGAAARQLQSQPRPTFSPNRDRMKAELAQLKSAISKHQSGAAETSRRQTSPSLKSAIEFSIKSSINRHAGRPPMYHPSPEAGMEYQWSTGNSVPTTSQMASRPSPRHASTSHASTSHASMNHASTNHASTSHASTNHASMSHASASHASASHALGHQADRAMTRQQPPQNTTVRSLPPSTLGQASAASSKPLVPVVYANAVRKRQSTEGSPRVRPYIGSPPGSPVVSFTHQVAATVPNARRDTARIYSATNETLPRAHSNEELQYRKRKACLDYVKNAEHKKPKN